MRIEPMNARGIHAYQQNQQPRPVLRPEAAPPADPDDQPVDGAEREFFAGLFPSAAAEIRSHTMYQRTGMQQSVVMGTLVDRKG